jgi:hypothetical protein
MIQTVKQHRFTPGSYGDVVKMTIPEAAISINLFGG